MAGQRASEDQGSASGSQVPGLGCPGSVTCWEGTLPKASTPPPGFTHYPAYGLALLTGASSPAGSPRESPGGSSEERGNM